MSCNLPLSRSLLPDARAVEQMQKAVWHPLISSNCFISQSVPGTASIIPASLKRQPSAVDMPRFSAQDLLASHVLDHIPVRRWDKMQSTDLWLPPLS